MRLYLSINWQGLEKRQSKPLVKLLSQAARTTINRADRWRLSQLARRLEISLLLTDDEGIRDLNREHRGMDKPTDVLSFPLWEQQPPLAKGGALALGDIVISVERAEAQAAEYGHSRKREAVFLFVHGFLHLLGYDHEQGPEAEKHMFSLQEQIMRDLALAREENRE